MRNKRPSLRLVLERHGVTRTEQLGSLKKDEIEKIRQEVEYFESNPQITDKQIIEYYRDGAELRNNIADSIGENGRSALENIKSFLPKKRVN